MRELHLLRPEALWLLCFPLLYIIGKLVAKHRLKRRVQIPNEVLFYLLKAGGKRHFLIQILPIVAFIAGVFALAGPVSEKLNETDKESDKVPDIAMSLVMDLSDYVTEQDVTNMKVMAYKMLDSLSTERVSLVVQSGSSHILIPYTSDYRLVRSYLRWVSKDIMPVIGRNKKSVLSKVLPPDKCDYHTVIYFSPDSETMDIGKVLTEIRTEAKAQLHQEELKNAKLWKDRGYMICWIFTIFLLPLFLKYNSIMVLLPVCLFMTTSCDYSKHQYNNLATKMALVRKDTLKAIEISDSPYVRGMLWLSQDSLSRAVSEFSKDSSCVSMYNAALATTYAGNYMMGLNMFHELSKKRPGWTFVEDNIHELEVLLSLSLSESTANSDEKNNQDHSSSDTFDNYEKDNSERKLDGSEEVLWADKLVINGDERLNYSKGIATKKREVVFRQVENNPKLFIKRRLEHEYERE